MVSYIINGLRVLVIVDAVSTWLLREGDFPRSLTNAILGPVYRPIRAVLSPFTGPFDASPLVAIVVLTLVQGWLRRRHYE